MARYAYERLDSVSATLLDQESSRGFGHAGAILIFEPGPLGRADGGVDFAAIRTAIEANLYRVPRFRSKLRRIPFENHPILVDDHEFNLDYHVRHTSLPRPGTMEQLRRVAARVQSQRLDRSRPLWELWVLEGLAEGRFAILTKIHNALYESTDADLLEVLLSADPSMRCGPVPPYRPRPVPSALELVRDEVVRQARLPRRAYARLAERLEGDPVETLRNATRSAIRMLGYSVSRRPDTPFNGSIGPHRRFDHLTLRLADARRVRDVFGGTIHDVILATLSGAVTRYLRAHFVNPATLDFRVAVPVSLRDSEEEQAVGEWILDLPIWEGDPVRCLESVRERTAAQQRETPGIRARALAEPRWTSSRRLSQGVRALSSQVPVSMRIVNVPGPQIPLYLEGAKLIASYGKVPLRAHGGLGVAIMSYDGMLCWGLNADFDLVPDLQRFSEAIRDAFDALVRAAAHRTTPLSVVRGGVG
jgi:WS/DGAT/MGAT family acyltransferase